MNPLYKISIAKLIQKPITVNKLNFVRVGKSSPGRWAGVEGPRRIINQGETQSTETSVQTETAHKSALRDRDHRISMVSPVRSASSSHSAGPSRLLLQVTWKASGPRTCIVRYRRDLAFSNCTSESICITKHGAHTLTAPKISSSSLMAIEGVNGPFAVTERI